MSSAAWRASAAQLRAELRTLARRQLEEFERIIDRFQPDLGSQFLPDDIEHSLLRPQRYLQAEPCHAASKPEAERFSMDEELECQPENSTRRHSVLRLQNMVSSVMSLVASKASPDVSESDEGRRTEVLKSRKQSVFVQNSVGKDGLRRAITRQTDAAHVDQHEQIRQLIERAPCGTTCMRSLYDGWVSLQEPPRKGLLARIVTSSAFGIFSMLVILANTMLIVQDTNRLVEDPQASDDSAWKAIRYTFTGYYTLEIVLKLLVHGGYFFINSDGLWNTFDFILVLLSYMEFLLNPSFLRILRLVKVARIARMLRAVRFFEDLRTIVASLIGCMLTMLWSLVLMTFLLCVFSIYFVQMGVGHAGDNWDSLDQKWWESFQSYFGSVSMGMLSLLAVTNGGEDWLNVWRIIAFIPPSELNSCLLVFAILFFQLAVYNIVMSSFIDRAVKSTLPTMEENMEKKLLEDQMFVSTLFDLMSEIDWNCDGHISEDEFGRAMMSDHKVCAFLKLNGLDIKDSRTFFDMLSRADDGGADDDDAPPKSRKLNYSDFVNACCRLRGAASTLDMSLVSYDLKTMHQHQAVLMRKMREQFIELDSRLKSHSAEFMLVREELDSSREIVEKHATDEPALLLSGLHGGGLALKKSEDELEQMHADDTSSFATSNGGYVLHLFSETGNGEAQDDPARVRDAGDAADAGDQSGSKGASKNKKKKVKLKPKRRSDAGGEQERLSIFS